MNSTENRYNTFKTIDGFKQEIGDQFEYELFQQGIRVPFLQGLFLEFFEMVQSKNQPAYHSISTNKFDKFTSYPKAVKNEIAKNWYEGVIFRHIGSWIYQAAVDGLPKLQEKNNNLTLEKLVHALVKNEVKKLKEAMSHGTGEFHKKMTAFTQILKRYRTVQLDLLQSRLDLYGIYADTNIYDINNYIIKTSDYQGFQFNAHEGYNQLQEIFLKHPNNTITSFFAFANGLHTSFVYNNIDLINRLLAPTLKLSDINLDAIKIQESENIKVIGINEVGSNFQVGYQIDGKPVKNTLEESIILHSYLLHKDKQSKFEYITKFGVECTILRQHIAYFVEKLQEAQPIADSKSIFKSIEKKYGNKISTHIEKQFSGLENINWQFFDDHGVVSYIAQSQSHGVILKNLEGYLEIYYLQKDNIVGYQTIGLGDSGTIIQSRIKNSPFYHSFKLILKEYHVIEYLENHFEQAEIDEICAMLRKRTQVFFENNNHLNLFSYILERYNVISKDALQNHQVENSEKTGSLTDSIWNTFAESVGEIILEFAGKVDYSTDEQMMEILGNNGKLLNEIKYNWKNFFNKVSKNYNVKIRNELLLDLGNDGILKEIKKRVELLGYDKKNKRTFRRRLTIERILELFLEKSEKFNGRGILEIMYSDSIDASIKKGLKGYLLPFIEEAISFQYAYLQSFKTESFEKRNERIKYCAFHLFKAILNGNKTEILSNSKSLTHWFDEYEKYVTEKNDSSEDEHIASEQARKEAIEIQNRLNVSYNESIKGDREEITKLNQQITQDNLLITQANQQINKIYKEVADLKDQILEIEKGVTGSMISQENQDLLNANQANIRILQSSQSTIDRLMNQLKTDIASEYQKIENIINFVWLNSESEEEREESRVIIEQYEKLVRTREELGQKISQYRLIIRQSKKEIGKYYQFGLPKIYKLKETPEEKEKRMNEISKHEKVVEQAHNELEKLIKSKTKVGEDLAGIKDIIDSKKRQAKHRLMTDVELDLYLQYQSQLDLINSQRSSIQNTSNKIMGTSEKRLLYADLRSQQKGIEQEVINLLHGVGLKYLSEDDLSKIELAESKIEFFNNELKKYNSEITNIKEEIDNLDIERKKLKEMIEDSKSTDAQKMLLSTCEKEIELCNKKIDLLQISIKGCNVSKQIKRELRDIEDKIAGETSKLKQIKTLENKNKKNLMEVGRLKLQELRKKRKSLNSELQKVPEVLDLKNAIKLENEKIEHQRNIIKETKSLIKEGRMDKDQKMKYKELRSHLKELYKKINEITESKKGKRKQGLIKLNEEKPILEYKYKEYQPPNYKVSNEVTTIYSNCMMCLKTIDLYKERSITEEEYKEKYLYRDFAGGKYNREIPTILTELNKFCIDHNQAFTVNLENLVGLCEQEAELLQRRQKGLENNDDYLQQLRYPLSLSTYGYKLTKQLFDRLISEGLWFDLYDSTATIRDSSEVLHKLFIQSTNKYLHENAAKIVIKNEYCNKIADKLGLFTSNGMNLNQFSQNVQRICHNYSLGMKKINGTIEIPNEYINFLKNQIATGALFSHEGKKFHDIQAVDLHIS